MLVSIIIPCLNEEKAVGQCVMRGIKELKNLRIKTEIIVVDNGSTDKSREVAKKAGAIVVFEPRKGYGRALLAGFEKAKGEYIIFADGDGSYDFSEASKLIDKLLKVSTTGPAGAHFARSYFDKQKTRTKLAPSPVADLVIGSRLKGNIQKGAMPFLHRYVGTPILNFLFKFFFHQNISDVNSGFRGISKKAFDQLRLKASGMEFASEMIYKAGKLGLKIAEVPITYKKRIGTSKLSPFRDAWRHLKFMLLFSSTYLFLIPGLILGSLGGLGMLGLVFGPQKFLGRIFDFHTMMASAFLLLLGFQIVFLGLFAKVFAMNFLEEENKFLTETLSRVTLEKGIILGLSTSVVGGIGVLRVLWEWWQNSFGVLADERLLLFGLTLFVLGVEIIFSSFFFGIIAKEER